MPHDVGPDLTQVQRIEDDSESKVEPFLRWVGGKQLLLRRLHPFLPTDVDARVYWEPFLGAASLFLWIRPNRAFLSDANPHLIACYEHLRRDPQLVHEYLQVHASLDSVNHYYNVRKAYNAGKPSAEQAARFVYLNRTCFNGVFRVNLAGEFNVPYGYKRAPRFPSPSLLQAVADAFRPAELGELPFQIALSGPEKGDFVYLDPPYPPLNGTSFFTHYTMDRFNNEQQSELAEIVKELDRRGALFMMTNADTPVIRGLYSEFYWHRLEVTRYVTCKAERHKVGELVITNYEIEK